LRVTRSCLAFRCQAKEDFAAAPALTRKDTRTKKKQEGRLTDYGKSRKPGFMSTGASFVKGTTLVEDRCMCPVAKEKKHGKYCASSRWVVIFFPASHTYNQTCAPFLLSGHTNRKSLFPQQDRLKSTYTKKQRSRLLLPKTALSLIYFIESKRETTHPMEKSWTYPRTPHGA
jgi:hypothetical protein